MTDVFRKDTGEQLLGGNIGVLTFDYVSNYVAGKVIPATSTQPATMRAVVNTVVKALGGAGVMMAGGKALGKSEDAGNILIGFGGGPIMTIANDWYYAFKQQNVGDSAFYAARSTKVARTPTAVVRSAPMATTTSVRSSTVGTSALRVGVY